MIGFKQKEFMAPVIAAALIGGAGTGASIIGNKKATAATNESNERVARLQQAQARKEMKAQEEAEKKDREFKEKQLKSAEQQQKQMIKLAKRNPQAAAALNPTVTSNVVTETQVSGEPKQATFSFDGVMQGFSGVMQGVGAAANVKAAKTTAKGNVEAARSQLAAQKAETEEKVTTSNNETALKMQELKNNKKQFDQQYKLANKALNKGVQPPQIKSYSAKPKSGEFLGFAKNLQQLAKDRNVKQGIVSTAVGGAVAVGGKYLVDKAIQRDIKKSGLEQVNEETPEQAAARQKARKRAALIGIGTAATAIGGGIAAKKGAFGTGAQTWANNHFSKAGLKSAGNTLKTGFLDAYTTKDEAGNRKVNKLGVGMSVGLTALPAVTYALKKRAYKNQIQQSSGEENEGAPERRTYSVPRVGGKGGINIGNFGNGVKTFFSGVFKKNGVAGNGTKAKAGAEAQRRIEHWKGGAYKSGAANNGGGGIFSGLKAGWQEFKKAPGQHVLGLASERFGGGGRGAVSKFGEDLERLGKKSNNNMSQKAGRFIKENPKTALVGSIGVGLGIAKLGGMGESVANKAIRAVDKDAFAYQERGTTFVTPKKQPAPQRRQQEYEEEQGEN